MNQKTFDGPSFVNPAYTSQNLNKGGSYQTPKVNLSNNGNSTMQVKNTENFEGKNKKGPRGGWEDDDSAPTKINPIKTSNHFLNNNVFNKPNSVSSVSSLSSVNNNVQEIPNQKSSSSEYYNYWDAENTKKIQNSTLSVEYETKLIDGILLPTGVTIKPSENNMKDFLKRLKTLNKQTVLKILLERLEIYESITGNDQVKILQVRN